MARCALQPVTVSTPRPEQRSMPELTIYADLNCELDSAPISIRSAGRTIVVEVPDVATGFSLFRLSSSRGTKRWQLAQLKKLLDTLLIAIEVKIAGRSVLRIGHKIGTPFWILFGLPPLSFSAYQALRAWAAADYHRS